MMGEAIKETVKCSEMQHTNCPLRKQPKTKQKVYAKKNGCQLINWWQKKKLSYRLSIKQSEVRNLTKWQLTNKK